MTADGTDDVERLVARRIALLTDNQESIALAVSGGGDSLALMHAIAATRGDRRVVVVHVDHGINPASATVAATVNRAAVALGLTCFTATLQLGPSTSETRARAARRAALETLAEEHHLDLIATAHHAEDQAETVLMRVLKGSGAEGLAAMTSRQGRWIKPLLDVSRAKLADYLVRRGVTPWHDPANSDPIHLRSWLRHDLILVAERRLGPITPALRRVAAQAESRRAAWDDVLDQVKDLQFRQENHGISVAAGVLAGYRSPLRSALVSAIGRRVGVRLGSAAQREIDHLLGAVSGTGIDVAFGVRAELAFGRLTLFRLDVSDQPPARLISGLSIDFGTYRFSVRSVMSVGAVQRDGDQTVLVPSDDYLVRRWQVGDRIVPFRGKGSRAVAVILREAAVPRSRRGEWPVVVAEREATIVWVPGICRSDARIPEAGTEGWNVDCVVS